MRDLEEINGFTMMVTSEKQLGCGNANWLVFISDGVIGKEGVMSEVITNLKLDRLKNFPRRVSSF
jgi:ABC-type histidine transport system ATPase subunit